MTRMYSVLLLLACVGCDESKATNPTPVAIALPARPVVAQCQPFDIRWYIDPEVQGAVLYPLADVVQAKLEEHSGDPWQAFAEWRHSISALRLHPSMRYRVQGKVGECWSTWEYFHTGDPNPDASSQTTARAPLEWTQCRNHYIVDETFDPPVVGPYRLTVRTEDRYHRAGYQAGQVETLAVSTNLAIGFTQDIPDNATWIETTWENLSGRIRVKRDQGSVHGVCVTVRQ